MIFWAIWFVAISGSGERSGPYASMYRSWEACIHVQEQMLHDDTREILSPCQKQWVERDVVYPRKNRK
jgi:hypothetical protein